MIKKLIKKEKTKKENKPASGGSASGGKAEDIEKLIPSLEEMLKAGAHFGHRTTKWHPNMEEYIFTQRENVHVIDLEKSREQMADALKFLRKIKAQKGVILFIGTKTVAKEIISQSAKECKMPYVAEKWVGGTLTNFKVISDRLEYFRNLKNKEKTGELKKYTKKEQHDFRVELDKLEKQFGGIKNLTKLPDAMMVVDIHKEKLAVKEAGMMGIPVVGLCDTDADPSSIDYPVPVNDDAITSLTLIFKMIVDALK